MSKTFRQKRNHRLPHRDKDGIGLTPQEHHSKHAVAETNGTSGGTILENGGLDRKTEGSQKEYGHQGLRTNERNSKHRVGETGNISAGKIPGDEIFDKQTKGSEKEYGHPGLSRLDPWIISSSASKDVLSPTRVAPETFSSNGSDVIFKKFAAMKTRRDMKPNDSSWLQKDAPASAENKNGNNKDDGVNNTSLNIPRHLADHLAKLNPALSNSSSSSSSSPYGENPVFPGIPEGEPGISDSGINIPGSRTGFHGDLGPSLFIPSGGAGHSLLPQPGFDHQDKCGVRCMKGSDCLHVKHKSAWQCICEGDLKPPHPETGCEPVPRGTVGYDEHQGVISADSHRGIVQFNEKNAGTTNQTLSMLRQPSDSSQSSNHVPEVVIPVVTCVVIVFLVGVFAYLYRRKRKLVYFKSKKDSILRNTDGAIFLENMNTITKNPTYYYQSATGVRKFNTRIVPAECIALGQVAGEGAFGQVFKGEMTLPDSDVMTKVAVKILKEGASHEAQEDFEREVEIMSAFDHDNILKLIGIVTQGVESNPYMIFEFMEHGDLTELLRRNDPCNRHVVATRNSGQAARGQGHAMTLPGGQRSRPGISLTKADLVDISVQIANGMSYLASQHFVHRDLATRNCLVGAGLVVKISDFGMSRDIYTNDYYRIGGSRMLPVRWMSPEAIKYGRFTCESDIWAYGVVLWEIFSFGKQPYYGHSNEEVIHFLDQGILLQRPEDCPSTIYHVMIGCWKRDPRQRIIFERLVKYLRDYSSHLMNSQRQQQQQQEQHRQQRQQQKQQQLDQQQQEQDRQPVLQTQLRKDQQQQQQQQKQQHQKRSQQQVQSDRKNEGSLSRSSSSSSDITDLSDVPNSPDDSNCPVTISSTPLTAPRAAATAVESLPPTWQGDYRQGLPDRCNTADTVKRTKPQPVLFSPTSTKSDANVSSMLLKSAVSARPSYHSHHQRSLTLPTNNNISRPLFRSNISSSKVPNSPKFFRAFSSKKAKKAASYSALSAIASRDNTKGGEEHIEKVKEGRRRYSSGEENRFGSLKNLVHSKLSGSFAIDTSNCNKPVSMECVQNSSGILNKTVGCGNGVIGNLLMDRLNASNKKSLAAPNTYDTSLLRPRVSTLPAGSNIGCNVKSTPIKPAVDVSGGNHLVCSQFQRDVTMQESSSTGIRLEWNDSEADSSGLRRAQSQREALITSGSLSCDLA